MLFSLVVCLGFTASLANSAVIRRQSTSKKGLAFNDATLCSQFPSKTITWGYDWDQKPQAKMADGRDYVPMLWGDKTFPSWKKNADGAVAKGVRHLIAFNEPDIPSQASMTIAHAVAMYKKHMMPYANKVLLGGPAVTNSGTPGQGLDWLRQFIAACDGCKIDFIPMHWYDPTGNIDYFKKHMNEAKAVAGGRKVWLTEFGVPNASQEKQVEFLKQVLPWMDSQDWIERYSYYGVFEGLLIQGGSLSPAGKFYGS